MCGIFATITKKPLAQKQLMALLQLISHRGPNAEQLHLAELKHGYKLALGHTRLSILDLSNHANQPFTYGNKSLIFNGEIYNHNELRTQLKKEGVIFTTNSDTEVLLHAYRVWGMSCLEKLNGMFAFALWDPELDKLLVARDRFGEKPLFWAKLPDADGLILSSEMKIIHQYPGFVTKVATETLAAFIHNGRSLTAEHKTPFHNIFQLAPANAMLINQRGEVEKKWQYWQPNFDEYHESNNDADLAEEFYYLFEKSVLERVACDVQVGASLSGGLDSTAIVGVLNKHRPANFASTISVRFDADPTISEGNYIDAAKKSFNLNHLMITPNAQDLMADSAKIHWHHEVPLPSASMFLQWSVMKRAREVGNIVMLDGQGSDELLGGYPYYFPYYQREALRHFDWINLFKNTYAFKKFLTAEAAKYPDAQRRINLNVVLGMPQLFAEMLKNSIKGLVKPLAPQQDNHPNMPADQDKLFKGQIAKGLQYTVLQEILHSADRNGMAFGIETRFPFLDYNLVDWCIKLSRHQLVRQGYQKYILRKSLASLIPTEIAYRKDKLGFLPPQDAWMAGDLYNWVKERLFDSILKQCSFYDQNEIEKILHGIQTQPHAYSNLAWRWASLSEWMRVFNIKF